MSDSIVKTVPKFIEVGGPDSAYSLEPGQALSANNSMYGLATNYANSNKWIATFPLEDLLGSKYKNIDLHLTRFSIPQLEQSSSEVAYKGYKKQIPTKVINADTKEFTLEYIVDEKWQNYKALYAWMSGIAGVIDPVVDTSEQLNITPSDYLTLRIYLLDNYKKKIIQFAFYNCWIKTFNEIALEQNNPAEVTHSFTCAFDSFAIESV